MKQLILQVLLILSVPLTVSASSVTVTGQGGTLWIGAGGLATSSSSGFTSPSQVGRVNNLFGKSFTGANLGQMTLSTGALSSGSQGSNATFAGGGSFTIALNGSVKGLPSAVVFQGTFSGPVSMTQQANGTFVITGNISGLLGARLVNGTTTLITGGLLNGQLNITGASVNIALPVPEPGTLTLLGTGLLGAAMLVRRKRSFSTRRHT